MIILDIITKPLPSSLGFIFLMLYICFLIGVAVFPIQNLRKRDIK